MKKLVKRWIAGVSAAALLVSAVGFDTFTNVFMRTASAEETGKNGRSTGFPNLEQDTTLNNEYYNTGYGLHTNKTATEVNDGTGRTFDVNLESWYVGENPVDVATILDASGSMAWTVDTLKPLEIDFKCFDDYEKAHTGVTIDSIADLQKIQDGNEGYLPQEVVDCILDPKNTDNSKLSYADYMYYVYEARSSVSEFVPLGYWDGGSPLSDASLIGYYPFNGTLENAKGGTATYIKHAEEGGSFNEDDVPMITVEPVFTEGGKDLQLDDTAANGALLADVKASGSFTVAMRVRTDVLAPGKTGSDNITPLVCIGSEGNYISLYRNNSDLRRLKVDINNANVINIGNFFQLQEGVLDTKTWVNILLSYNAETGEISVDLSQKNAEKDKESDHFVYNASSNDLNFTNADIIIGGDVVNTDLTKGYTDMQLTEFCVFNKALTEDELGKVNTSNQIKDYDKMNEIGSLIGYYDFGDKDSNNKLGNRVDGGSSLTFIEQAEGKTFSKTEITSVEAKPVYSDDKNNGSHSLNVSQTAKLGSVLLDAHPTSKNYTLTFAIKKYNDTTNDNGNFDKNAEIMYIGSSNLADNDYYSIKRHNHTLSSGGDDRHLRFFNGTHGIANVSDVFQKNNDDIKWSYITYVFENGKLRVYKDGEKAPSSSGGTIGDLECAALNTATINFIIAGLKDEYNGSDILLDDLYVFNKALTETEVNLYFSSKKCEVGDSHTHARTIVEKDGKQEIIEIAQIANGDNRIVQNPDPEQRRGWYYVNSLSDWADISGCLASGKQYIGIYTDEGITDDLSKDTATVPPEYNKADDKVLDSITKGNTNDKKYDAPPTERSIRFYVDSESHLRCFVWSGNDSKADNKDTDVDESDPRTFCSLVYTNITTTPPSGSSITGEGLTKEEVAILEKMNAQENALKTRVDATGNETYRASITKYEKLNVALNLFYEQLAENSDLTNTSIVRFSTNNAADKTKDTEGLKKLIMANWMSWSTYQQDYRSNHSTEPLPEESEFMKDILIPAANEKADTPTNGQYPYVMTGGTYTWTGLKAFYENMVDDNGGTNKTNKDIANDGRDKYLIIFTDGRDNTQDSTFDETTGKFEKNGTNYKKEEDATGNKPEGSDIDCNGLLAEAWANELKKEGYTIYCVMMATGSISEETNKDEFDRARNFLRTIAGKEGSTSKDKDIDNYVIITKPTSTNINETAVGAFQQILDEIQKPRDDYTVQDYIDPRFDLIGKDADGNNVIYHLGANGKITFTDTENKPIEEITVAYRDEDGTTKSETITSGENAENIIGAATANGILYTPMKSYMVNRSKDSKGNYTNGDGLGTGYLYYDDEKDMYYLRWTKQIIPMAEEAFDTESDHKKLDVWSATIRLKAKDDFIGGNNILTNGNEAGENLVFSSKTLELMEDNWEEYKKYEGDYKNLFADETKYSERVALQTLSGYNRKVNAIDADGISQAVYGDGINVPSCGFPRVTVDVRLLPINTKPLNDVIYMGEVVSPTMMLAEIEDDYMSGSYYLEYLERYAFRLYGEDLTGMPLIDLLNEWLQIKKEDVEDKTFTIPYIYLPAPEYKDDNKLEIIDGKVKINNSTGATWKGNNIDFNDLNLRDVTGFITYTWSRTDMEQQQYDPTIGKYNITKDYVVKDTKQIQYNLQLTFTPLQEGNIDFSIADENFITGDKSDQFFKVGTDHEFTDKDGSDELKAWEFQNRSDYLKAMVKETHIFKPAVAYDSSENVWKFVGKITLPSGNEIDGMLIGDALNYYKGLDESKQTSSDLSSELLTDKGVYDWDTGYKPVAGNPQIEKEGVDYGDAKITDYSLEANTTYTKDVVNAALALELFVDGEYLGEGSVLNPISGDKKTFEFIATRYYDDPYDPQLYDPKHPLNADTGEVTSGKVKGKNYKLTFTVDEIPKDPQKGTIYQVWATLTEVKVEKEGGTGYVEINDTAGTDHYTGYTAENALPIGTYVIESSDDASDNNSLNNSQFIIKEATAGGSEAVHFKYLKTDNTTSNYTYDKFPDSVYEVSQTAFESTKDPEYLIKNGANDFSRKNIAESDRTKDTDTGMQTITFNFGTVDALGNKGKNRIDDPENDYAKDRLGIIMLSSDNNSLTLSKEVTNTEKTDDLERVWDFNITITTKEKEWFDGHTELKYKLYTWNEPSGDWVADSDEKSVAFNKTSDTSGEITLTATLKLKHDQKAVFEDLPDGTWTVEEESLADDPLYTPHNNAYTYSEEEWIYRKAAVTSENTLTPASQVDFINEFPYELPSTGDIGTDYYIFFGTMLTVASVLFVAWLWYDRRKRRAMHE